MIREPLGNHQELLILGNVSQIHVFFSVNKLCIEQAHFAFVVSDLLAKMASKPICPPPPHSFLLLLPANKHTAHLATTVASNPASFARRL
jgi:hypothetical protein